MKYSFILLAGIVTWTTLPVFAAESTPPSPPETKVEPPAKADPTKSEGAKEEKNQPSEMSLSKNAQKNLKKVETTVNHFDPQVYTCKQLMKDIDSSGDNTTALEIVIVWAHGYFSAIYSTDSTGALDEKVIPQTAQDLVQFCNENPSMNLSRAVKLISSDE